MEIFFTISIIYLYLRLFQQLKGILKSRKFFRKREKRGSLKQKITVLIPIHCEDRVIRHSIDFWQKSPIKPIFVISERDKLSGCRGEMIVSMLSDFQIIISPNKIGFKASQLNYALSQIELKGYIGIFDIDSRPDLRVFEYLSYLSGDIYQMPTKFLTGSSIFSKGSAIYQTRRVLSFEVPSLLDEKFTYLVGHGLFVKGEIFYKNIFNEKSITEDLIFGYQLYLSGYRAKPLPFFETSHVPETLSSTLKQSSRWFIGDFEFVKYINFKSRDLFNIFRRYLHILDWLWGSVGVIFIFLFSSSYFQISILVALLIFLYIHYLTIRLANIDFSFTNFIGVIYRASLNSLAPLYGIYKLLLEKIGIEKLTFERTEK